MIRFKTVSFTIANHQLFSEHLNGAASLDFHLLDMVPDLAESLIGWDIINGQVIPGEDTSRLVFFLRGEDAVPDDAGGLED
jgi:hypothetical protein